MVFTPVITSYLVLFSSRQQKHAGTSIESSLNVYFFPPNLTTYMLSYSLPCAQGPDCSQGVPGQLSGGPLFFTNRAVLFFSPCLLPFLSYGEEPTRYISEHFSLFLCLCIYFSPSIEFLWRHSFKYGWWRGQLLLVIR